jgi:2-polyprenyl-3-methyl-5-hydroxy-6-metoxy-1,4-benzoquinol methylase
VSDFAGVPLDRVPCALCGADDTRPRFSKFDLPIVQCNHCRLVYANPRLPKEQLWTRYTEDYFWNEYMRTLQIERDGPVDLDKFAIHHGPLLSLYQMYHPPPGRLLEVGAAAGLFMKSAQRAGWTVQGLEPLPAAAAFARERLGLDVVQDTIENAPYEAESFDAVALFETIEHVLDPLAMLRAIHRLMRPRGLLVLTTPNWEAFTRHALGEQWAVISPAEHVYYFSEATLTAMLKRAGFTWVHYHRDIAPRALETMFADYTHAPGSARHLLYSAFVKTIGPLVFHEIQRRGLADQLVCVARA